MAVKSNNQPAPQRQVVLTFATPSVADILFYETVDGQRIGTAVPDYGTPHPDSRKWPNHKLVLIQNDDETGQMLRYYYAADRVAQEEHNWQVSYPYAGLTTCPRFTCVFIEPDETFNPVAKGTAHPLDLGANTLEQNLRFVGAKLMFEEEIELPEELRSIYHAVQRVYDKVPTIAEQEAYNFEVEYPYLANTSYPRTIRRYVVPRADLSSAVIPSAGLNLNGATLAARKVDRFEGQPEDSLYVLVTTVHDKIPLLSSGTDATFLSSYGYQVTRPYGTDDHSRVEWKIPALKGSYSAAVDYSACPITGYTGLFLTDETVSANPDNAGTVDVIRVYDSLPGPSLASEEREKFASVPEGFIVERKIETLRQPVKNDATISALDNTAPNVTGGALIQTRLGAGGANTVILEKGSTRLTATFGSLTGVEYDSETGKVFDVTRQIVPAGTAGANLNGSGEFSTIDPINQYFSIKETRKATTLGTGTNGLTWEDVVNYSWPAVLEAINIFQVVAKDGHTIRYGYDVELKESYSGPCRATITETWSSTAQSLPTLTYMQPRAIEFDFPMTRNFSIPQTLHPAFTMTEVIGTNHPELAYTTTTKAFPATNYTDWPASIVAAVSQTPYRGGFKMRKVVVYKPGT